MKVVKENGPGRHRGVSQGRFNINYEYYIPTTITNLRANPEDSPATLPAGVPALR